MKPTEQLLRDALKEARPMVYYIAIGYTHIGYTHIGYTHSGEMTNRAKSILEVIDTALAATSHQAEGEVIASIRWQPEGKHEVMWHESKPTSGWIPVCAAPLPAQPQGQGADTCFDTDEFWNLLCNWADARTSGEPRSAREENAQDAILAYLNSAAPPSQAPEPAQQEAAKTGEHEPKAGELTGKTGELAAPQAAVPTNHIPDAGKMVSDEEIWELRAQYPTNSDTILFARELLARALARTAPVVAEGFVIVPKEPTPEIIAAAAVAVWPTSE